TPTHDAHAATKAYADGKVPHPSIVTVSATASNALAAHAWNYVRATSGSTLAYTVQPNATIAHAVGTIIYLRPVGGTEVEITAGAGVTVNAPAGGSLVLTGDAALIKVATNEWDLIGSTEPA